MNYSEDKRLGRKLPNYKNDLYDAQRYLGIAQSYLNQDTEIFKIISSKIDEKKDKISNIIDKINDLSYKIIETAEYLESKMEND